ncbi:hypothetical protein ADIWIN_0432 [Winogradskyella psychrotolerans RS-3]|jgi:hypothetical protein|uniref:DUF1569 domain-containing protein n=1 Tax=Winogradskyella psychrotolerans RS-3 TaxID=641526 RepID=S7VYL6_9FLAO|nr:DUF1569 domain-containing protein [Winogradskyella psychrotolerans]EPR74532.1 hypothetical protein ADIWIN_0432 [Winogradskyella psychrotolerans RS-3]
MKNIFDKTITAEVLERINKLKPTTTPIWGKMSCDQMLAHCNVTYELDFEDKHPKPKGFMKWMLKTFIKNTVVSEKPYKKNGRTAPAFLITNEKDFHLEKDRLAAYITKTQELGSDYFDQKESHSFGKLSKTEWSNMYYKHIDHHLTQFGV